MELTDTVLEQFRDISHITIEQSPAHFFKTLVDFVLPTTPEEIRHHVVQKILVKFTKTDELYPKDETLPFNENFFEYDAAIATHPSKVLQFERHVHVGDHALFISGMHSQFCEQRRQLRDTKYYEAWGKNAYHVASGSEFAKRIHAAETLWELAHNFRFYRQSLNELAERFIPISKEFMKELLLDECDLYKKTRNVKHMESAQKRAAVLGPKAIIYVSEQQL